VKWTGWVAAACVAVILSGCNPSRESLAKFDHMYQLGQLERATEFCQDRARTNTSHPRNNDLLWALQLGAVERARKNYGQSTLWFDRCEEMMKVFDPQMRETDVIGTSVVNDNVIPYRGWAYDGIMVNTYKALNFMGAGDSDNARVEFNRAMERQTRAKEMFNAEIEKEKARLAKASEKKEVNYDKSVNSPQTTSKLKAAYPGLYDFQAYPDYVNPFSTYMAGVFFAATGDVAKARDLLRESAGMVPDNGYVQDDFARADRWLGGEIPGPRVWVFFENGLGPVKDEIRLDLPLFLFNSDVYYAGIALPKLVKRQAAGGQLSVYCHGQQYGTAVVGDMDRVIETEFAKEYPWILTRALLAAGVKATGQYFAANTGNHDMQTFLGVITAIYSAATTAADVRIWSALPKDFEVAAMPMPEDGQIVVMTPGGRAYPLNVGACGNAIVYIKMISAYGEPMVEVMKF
jgi:uncharacterized protein